MCIRDRIGTSAGRAIGKARRARSGLKSVGKETKAGDAKRNQKRRSRSGASNDALDEVNRILDKIGERGMDSLTPAELDFLNEMSQQKSDPDLKH